MLLVPGRSSEALTVYIAGAGGLAREIYSWLLSDMGPTSGISFGGFIVDDAYERLPVHAYLPGPRLGLSNIGIADGVSCFLLGVGAPASRRGLFDRCVARGLVPASLVHATAIIGEHVQLGRGVVVCPAASLTTSVTVSDGVLINVGARIGHDSIIGPFTSLLGNNTVNGDVVVGEEVLLGAGSLIFPGTRIGARVVVGMGSVVVRSVEADTTVFGNPAKKVSRRA